MKLFSPLALLLSVGGWALLALVFINLLSGHLDQRTCGTDCVQTYFFAATGMGGVALLASLVALFSSGTRWLSVPALLLALPLCGVIAGLFLIGNYGNLLH
jgi:hypothetical protein